MLAATAASAGGFQVSLAGIKNNGMGGVGTGLALDQASMFYNPGALAMVRERGVQMGANATFARQAFRAEFGGEERTLRNSVVNPFSLFAGFGPAEGQWKAGIAVYTPFGSNLRYADGWEGRFSLTDIDLKSVFVQPTVSFALTDQLSVGVGVAVLAYGSVNLQRDVPVTNAQGEYGHVELDGKAENKVGFNAGVFFKPSDKLSVGVSYRSKIDATVKGGDVTLTNLPASAKASFSGTEFDVTIPLPATTTIGIGVMPTEKLTIAVDVNHVQWSKYRSLDFTFNGPVGGATSSTSKRFYQDALTLRLGGQYKLTDVLTVRAGGSYDMSPVKDGYVSPETPDSDRIGATAGVSYKAGEHFSVDVSTQFISLMKRTQTQQDLLNNKTTDRVAGTYKTQIVIPGIGLIYTF
jgi:long-chain fatty acid transport protein